MSKTIQSFEAWGYRVEPDAKGFKFVSFSLRGKHCNIWHSESSDPDVPINTFTVDRDDKTLLKIPRTFNNSEDGDRRPKSAKLALRDQMVSFWTLVEHRDLRDLKTIKYVVVIEQNLQAFIEEVYEMKGADEYDEVTLYPSEPAFQMLLQKTPFLAGAQKMLIEYAAWFAGKSIQSCTFHPEGGFESFDFTITLT